MNSDYNKPQVPAKPEPNATQVHKASEVQTLLGYLPQSDSIDTEEKISIAQAEGYDSLAIELAIEPYITSAADKLLLVSLAVLATALIIFLFPSERFFKPKTEDIGPMTIGGPIIEENLAQFKDKDQPWLKVLLEMDRLYFRDGKLTEAILLAESALEKVPERNWQRWRKVHYRYWELLSDAGRSHSLKTATGAYLQTIPEDPFANYYYAHAFLSATERIRFFNRAMKASFRQEAETIAQKIDRACSALKAQKKYPIAEEKKVALTELYQKLRLQQAKLYVLNWKLGGYQEDQHPDVVYRDKALDICDNQELSNLREAKELKITVYTHILDRWYWFEGQQVIQGKKQKRRRLAEELKALKKELKDVEKL